MKDAVDVLNERIDGLLAENADLKARIDRWNSGGNYVATNAKIKELKAENERLRKKVEVQGFNLQLREIDGSMDVDALIKDAERYRWLRGAGVWITQASGLKCYRNTKADTAIDAAMWVE